MGTKLDFPGGGYIIVNDPAEVPGMIKFIHDINQRDDQFHHKLIGMGVKAYRCNDGWVDRDNHIVTFFDHEKERGWYWGNMSLTKGDKIFLGNPSDGGQFAIVDGIAEERPWCTKYHYHLIDEYIRYDEPKRKSLWSKICGFVAKISSHETSS